jgi:hypothetical protein
MSTAEGCPASVIDVPTLSAPLVLTPKPDKLEPPLFGTKTQFPSCVIAPVSGLAPVEMDAGDCPLKAPVAGLYLYSETWEDPLSTAYTKSRAGLTMNEIGRVPAPVGEFTIWVSVPSALGQVVVTCMQAEKTLMLFEPLLATNR